MKKIKIDSNYILIGLFVLVTGLVLGIGIGSRGLTNLEGMVGTSLSDGLVATDPNATASNATSANATSANATSSNATASNASRTDNILYLNAFSLQVESAKPGDKVYVGKMTTGACNSGMSIQFNDVNNPVNQFTVNVENLSGVPYFVVPKNIISGTYYANKIVLIGLNSDNTTFSRCYGHVGVPSGCQRHEYDVKLKIVNEVKKDIKLETLTLATSEALVGEKVNVSYKANESLNSLKMVFKNDKNRINVTVKDLDKNPYFEIPSTSKEGEYTLSRISVMTEDSSIVYEGDNNKFNIKLTVKDNSLKTYVFNNSEITEEIISKLYDDNEVKEITVNVDESSLISEDLFKTIIGTSRKLIINVNDNQIIFDGRDIKEAKAIDVHMTTNLVQDDTMLPDIIKDGVVVNFVDNGNLPGNALVRLKATTLMRNKFSDHFVYVYYFDEVAKGFNLIGSKLIPKDDYYEFTISHNSKYVLTIEKIDENLVIEEEKNDVVDFKQSDNTYLVLICGALILVLVVIVILLVLKNKKGKELGN